MLQPRGPKEKAFISHARTSWSQSLAYTKQVKTAKGDDRATARRTRLLVQNESSLWIQNDGTIFLWYQHILAFSDMIISKLVESESGFQKNGGERF